MIQAILIGGDPYTGKTKLLATLAAAFGERAYTAFGKSTRFYRYDGPRAIVIKCGPASEQIGLISQLAAAPMFRGWTVLAEGDTLFSVHWIDALRKIKNVEPRLILLDADHKDLRRRMNAAGSDSRTEQQFAAIFGRVAAVRKRTGRYKLEIWPHNTEAQLMRLATELSQDIVNYGSPATDGRSFHRDGSQDQREGEAGAGGVADSGP